VSRGNDSVMW